MRGKNFELVSVAEDIGGLRTAGPWIERVKPTFTVLIDAQHTVATLYDMVNVPTGVWIDETSRIVRPNETTFIDNRYTGFHGIEAAPYLDGLRDWLLRGAQSPYVMSPEQMRQYLALPDDRNLMADTYFKLAQHLVTIGHERDAIPYFKQAQQRRLESWNYKRQAWQFADPETDYGTNFQKEVKALNGKPFYPPLHLPKTKSPQDSS